MTDQLAPRPGAALPAPQRERFEASLGRDLGSVRVHTDATAADEAASIDARAFAEGNDISFAAGQYDLGSTAGQYLLAHEVAHTQQAAAGVHAKAEVSSPGDACEVEADAAAAAMVRGAPFRLEASGGAAIRRTPAKELSGLHDPKTDLGLGGRTDPAADTDWTDAAGPALIKGVRAGLAAWETYRMDPASGKGPLPGVGAVKAAVAAFVKKLDDAVPAALKERASQELGSHDLALLEEMITIDNDEHDAPRVFNVTRRVVKHTYGLTLTSVSGSSRLGIQQGTVEYMNNLPHPWRWTQTFMVGLLEVSIDDPIPHPFTISGSFECTRPPQLYVGWEDMNGPVTGLNGPSAVIPVPPGSLKIKTGLGLRFPGGVDFEHFELDWSGAKGGELNVDMGAVGGGAHTLTKEADVATKAIATGGVVVDAQREQVAVIRDFATESAELPPGGDVVIEQLVQELLDFKRAQVDPGNTELERHGIDPEQNFTIDLEVEGWASLRWTAALTDAERRQRNLDLSRRRAETVAGLTASRLAHLPVRPTITPRGSGIIPPLGPGDEKKPTSEDEIRAEIDDLERRIAELEKRITLETSIGHDITALVAERDELRARIKEKKALIDPRKPDADDSELHQARIRLHWRGKRIDNGMPTAPTKLTHH